MKIEVLQTECVKKNEFEIRYNGILKYKASLPFVSINEPFGLEKIRDIKIFDISGNEVYSTKYEYAKNLMEETVPMKYLVTKSQKFYQLLFISNKNAIKIYYEENGIWNNKYVIEMNNKKYFCYSIEDGYIRHFPIYDGDIQIGEVLKSNVILYGKDEYCCYLENEYESLSDGIVCLSLYLDRKEYSSSYLISPAQTYTKSFSYNKTNKFYDKNWVLNNFGDEYYRKVEEDLKIVKEALKHPIKNSVNEYNSMPKKEKKLLQFILIAPWALMFIILLIVFIILLFSNL